MSETVDFAAIFEASPGCYLVLDPQLRIIAVTEAYLRVSLTTRANLLGRDIFVVFPDNPADQFATGVSNLRASLERALKTKAPDAMAVQKYDVRGTDGVFEERYWSPLNTPVLGPDGEVRYLLHQVEDVTEFVRVKQQGGRMEAEVFRRAQELQATNERLRSTEEALRRANEALEQRVVEGQAALGRTEDQLRQAQKMEAIGRLAGGVAHDFNNLLSVVLSYSSMLMLELQPGDPSRDDVAEILKAGERASALTRQLLAFSRQQVLQPRVIDLNAVITDMSKLLQRLLGEDLELTTNLGALAPVKVDPGQLEQVVMNLAVNARDAMPNGGTLRLETSMVAGQVQLAVIDSGLGMSPETQARIFEPFFTTKDKSKGTGLGLSMVLGIVEQSGGTVKVISAPGVGTSMLVLLPAVDEAPEALTPDASTPRPLPRRDATILLVEDDEQVRTLIHELLRREGYTVLCATGPDEALAVASQATQPIDLVLTDVVMPRMNGWALAQQLRSTRPSLRVLFMSGYTDDPVTRRLLEAGQPFIQKPITPELVLQRLATVLG